MTDPALVDAGIHIEARGITKIFAAVGGGNDVHALGPLDLDIRHGEFFTVVGPSGCGKSTLLDMLAGLDAATRGHASTFDGATVAAAVPDGIGVVFQEDASFPWLTVWDNVAFGLRRRGVDARGDRAARRPRARLHGPARFRRAPIRRSFPAACASASASRARWCCSRA